MVSDFVMLDDFLDVIADDSSFFFEYSDCPVNLDIDIVSLVEVFESLWSLTFTLHVEDHFVACGSIVDFKYNSHVFLSDFGYSAHDNHLV